MRKLPNNIFNNQVNSQLEKISKFLSYILRHKPKAIGLTLDVNGWASIADLIVLANQHNRNLNLTPDLILATVDYDHKQRYSLSPGECSSPLRTRLPI
jgi:putative RNA 2'-phosphotransferase